MPYGSGDRVRDPYEGVRGIDGHCVACIRLSCLLQRCGLYFQVTQETCNAYGSGDMVRDTNEGVRGIADHWVRYIMLIWVMDW